MVLFWDKMKPQNFKGWSRFLTFLQLLFQKKKNLISNSENHSWDEPLILSSQDASRPFFPQCFELKNRGKFPESLVGRRMSLAESWVKNPKKRLLFLQVTFTLCSRLPRLDHDPILLLHGASVAGICLFYPHHGAFCHETCQTKPSAETKKNELNTAGNVLALWTCGSTCKTLFSVTKCFTDRNINDHLITKQKKCFGREWKDLDEKFFSVFSFLFFFFNTT